MGVVITTWLLFPCCESFPKVLADGRDDVFMTLIHDTVEVKFSGIKKKSHNTNEKAYPKSVH